MVAQEGCTAMGGCVTTYSGDAKTNVFSVRFFLSFWYVKEMGILESAKNEINDQNLFLRFVS